MPHVRASLLGSYAYFLESVRGRYDLAERFYRRAIQVDPDHVRTRGRFALFLEMVRRDYAGAEEQYQRALVLAPNDPDLLGNYADFLEFSKVDLDEAEAYYRRALEAAPYHVNNLTNYATFLADIRFDADRAEALYKRALEIVPNHRNALFKYALFLTDIRRDYTGAARLYARGLKVAPDNGAMMANYTGLLLMCGKKEEGLALLERALSHPSLKQPTADTMECWFYALVYGAPQGYGIALKAIRRLVEAGVKSPGFRLETHVAMGTKKRHPWRQWLEPLATAMLTGQSLEHLDEWEEWRKASPGVVH